MKNELQTLRREAAQLKARIGEEQKTVIFRALDADGNETGFLDFDGDESDPVGTIVLEVPDKAIRPLLKDGRHTVLHGGRSGGKSHSIARYLVSLAYSFPVKVLCVREIQLSIRDSVHFLLRDIIEAIPEFRDFFEVFESEIRGANGSIFIFRGMRKESAHSIKSYEGVNLAWVEEAQALSRRSIDLLIPTIRKSGSRLIWSLNPEGDDDPVYVDFLSETAIHDDAEIEQILYTDNCFCSAETRADAELDKRTNPAKYRHIWEGGLREKGTGVIFPDYEIIDDIPLESLPFRSAASIKSYGPIKSRFEVKFGKGSVFCGADTGHSGSPSHVLLGWIVPKYEGRTGRILILDEYRGIRKSPNELAREINEKLPILKAKKICVWIDAAATGDLQTFREHGFLCKSAPKWSGSVDEGIRRLEGATIQICERCEATIRDFSLYSWKLDANEAPVGVPDHRHSHAPDALRYGIHNWIKNKGIGYMVLTDPYI